MSVNVSPQISKVKLGLPFCLFVELHCLLREIPTRSFVFVDVFISFARKELSLRHYLLISNCLSIDEMKSNI
jgi:hypothetical protein